MANKDSPGTGQNDCENSPLSVHKESVDFSIQLGSPHKKESSLDLADEFVINLLSKNTKSPVSNIDNTAEQIANNLKAKNIGVVSDLFNLNSMESSADNSKLRGSSAVTGNVTDIKNNIPLDKPKTGDDMPTISPSNDSAEIYICERTNSTNNLAEELPNENNDKIDAMPVKLAQVADQAYRCEADSWLDDKSSSSTFSLDSSSDCDDTFLDKMRVRVTAVEHKSINIKTRGELDLDELPPIEDLHITVQENEIQKCGTIHAIVEKLVIIHALKNLQPLDIDSVLFLSPEKVLGRIFDVFGPVTEPFYSVRFNNSKDITDAGIAVDLVVFYAPQKKDITSYVFVDELRTQKGSDASWKDNNEPPEEYLDYSDDEQEKVARQKRRAKERNKNGCESQNNKPEGEPPLKVSRNLQNSNTNGNISSWVPRNGNHPNSRSISPVKNFSGAAYTYVSRPNIIPNSAYPSIKAIMSSNYKAISSGFQDSPQNSFSVLRSLAPRQQNVGLNYQTNPIYSSQASFRSPQPFISPSQQNPGLRSVPFYPSPQPVLQLQQQAITSLSPAFIPHQQAISSKPIATFKPPSHVFGQMTPLGPVSPAFTTVPFPPPAMQSIPFPSPAMPAVPFSSPTISAAPFPPPPMSAVHFSPPVVSSAPLLSISFSPASPNFSYFSHNHISAPSPPAPRPASPNSHWMQRQPVGMPPANVRVMPPPMSPLSIEIPNNMRSPPPSIPISAANTFIRMPSIQTVQRIEPFQYPPSANITNMYNLH